MSAAGGVAMPHVQLGSPTEMAGLAGVLAALVAAGVWLFRRDTGGDGDTDAVFAELVADLGNEFAGERPAPTGDALTPR